MLGNISVEKKYVYHILFSIGYALLAWVFLVLIWRLFGVASVPKDKTFLLLWVPGVYLVFTALYYLLFAAGLKSDFDKLLRWDAYTFAIPLLYLPLAWKWRFLQIEENGWFKLIYTSLYLGIIFIKVALVVGYLINNAKHRNSDSKSMMWSVFGVSLAFYLLLTVRLITWWPDGDEPHILMIAHSITHDFDTDVTDNTANHDGRFFDHYDLPLNPNHELGTAILIAPGYFLAKRAGAMVTMNILGALVAANVFLLGYETTKSTTAALWAWAFISFTSPMAIYSSQIFPEMPGALVTIWAFRKLRTISLKPINLYYVVLSAIAIVLLKTRFLSTALIMALLSLVEIGRTKKNLLFALGVLLTGSVIGLLAVRLLTGSFIPHRVMVFFNYGLDYFWTNVKWVFAERRGWLGLLLDQEFGLIPNAPIYLLVFVGLPLALKENWLATVMLLAVFIGYYFPLASIRQWHGAWAPPSRYIVSVVPLLGLLLAYSAKYYAGRFYTWAKGTLFAASLGVSFWYALAPSWRYNDVSGTNRLFNNLSSWLPLDMTKFLPSYVNLSENTFFLSLPWAILAGFLALYYYLRANKEVMDLGERTA